ncbi:MAG: hypothetical protein HZB38_04335 [Planctomycetes bacterium]|nr:hypothetical protein [Planctomycetota bacterium]
MKTTCSATILAGVRRALLIATAALLSETGSATAQVLQDGDLVIAAHRVGNGGVYYGRFLRLRGEEISVLFESGDSGPTPEVFGGTTDIIIDSHGRVVFAAGYCGNNSNNTALLRWDPATGQVSELLCIPYIVPPEGPPAGFPTDADYFGGVSGLHLTRSLKVSIDDDVNGGMPQAGFVEAYAFAVATTTYTPGEPFPFVTRGARIYRAQADLGIDIRAHTTVGGADVVVSGRLRVAGRNELVIESRILDNTALPNGAVNCDPMYDDNVPFDGYTSFRGHAGMHALGVLNGGIFVTANDGWRWLFDLGPRDPFLNPFCCCPAESNQAYGPYENALPDPPGFSYSTVHNGRVLGGHYDPVVGNGRVLAVSPSGYEVLASDPLLLVPKDVAPYPAETPALTAATVVIRVDSPVNVLATDAAGMRIGRDAAGNNVNDFGAEGAILALGAEGHPVVCAIINPAEGEFTLDAVGTGDGPYTLRAYRADTTGGAALASLSGTAAPNVPETIDLRLSPGMGVSLTRRCPGDVNGDQLVDLTDLATLLSNFGTLSGATRADGDQDRNGSVDLIDLAILLAQFGAPCP